MKLVEENISKILVKDMPEFSEYSQIIYDCRASGKLLDKDYAKFNELDFKVQHDLQDLMARCIARGIRLASD